MTKIDQRPNVLYIDCHDLGDWLGCYGCSYLRTPNIDSIAENGVRFSQYISTAPICMPSRASIYSGYMPHTAGVVGQDPLNDDVVCIAERLRRSRYDTVLCNQLLVLNEPEWAGFTTVLQGKPPEKLAADFLEDRTKDSANPFFLSVSFKLVHRPFGQTYEEECLSHLEIPAYLPDIPIVRKDLGTLCYQIEQLDQKVGLILDALSASGLANNTLVIFTTEHGPAVARAKHTLYDSGIRTSLVMQWPGRIQGGVVYEALISNLDLLPTVLELCGATTPDNLHGRSFLPLIDNMRYEENEAVFSEHTWGRRNGRWYYTPTRSIRTTKYHYIHSFRRIPIYVDNGWLARFAGDFSTPQAWYSQPLPESQLYDLGADPHELKNLAENTELRPILETLKSDLFSWLEYTSDPVLIGFVPNKQGMPDVPQWIEQGDGSFVLSPEEPLDLREQTFA